MSPEKENMVEGKDFEISRSTHPGREGWYWHGLAQYDDYAMPPANGGYMTKEDAIANAREVLSTLTARLQLPVDH